MRSKGMVWCVLVAVLAVAGCGSSKKKTTSTKTSPPPATTTATVAKKPPPKPRKTKAHRTAVPSRTYTLKLTGKGEKPSEAPKGSAAAVISVRGKSLQVCWRFSNLRGFGSPTSAHLYRGGVGTSGKIVVPFATPKFRSQGCAHATAGLLKAIVKTPHGYYVSIQSAKYPRGAVRSQL